MPKTKKKLTQEQVETISDDLADFFYELWNERLDNPDVEPASFGPAYAKGGGLSAHRKIRETEVLPSDSSEK